MEGTGEYFNSLVIFALIKFFYDSIVAKHFHEFIHIYKGHIQKTCYLDDVTEAQVISWMQKSNIKDLKPDVSQNLALFSSETIVHPVNLESR